MKRFIVSYILGLPLFSLKAWRFFLFLYLLKRKVLAYLTDILLNNINKFFYQYFDKINYNIINFDLFIFYIEIYIGKLYTNVRNMRKEKRYYLHLISFKVKEYAGMKKRKRISNNWIALNLMGIGIALSSSIGVNIGYAQDVIISNGDTVIVDVVGTPGNTDTIEVDQSSIWQGKLSVEQSGGAEVNISENSLWQGNVSINSGYTYARLVDSTWNGDIHAIGDYDNGYTAEMNIEMLNSQRTGNAVVEDGYLSTYMENSSFLGDIQITNGYGNMNLYESSNWEGDYLFIAGDNEHAYGYVQIGQSSSWKGDAALSLQDTSQGGSFYTNISDNSTWEGNINTSTSGAMQTPGFYADFHVNVYENSQWIGNADVVGSFHAGLGTNSQWIGNVKVENGENIQSAGAYVNIYDSSFWQGSMDFSNTNMDYTAYTAVYMESSRWIGNFKSTGSVTGNSVNAYNHSYWEGNLDVRYQNPDPDSMSYTNVSMGEFSQWIGNFTAAGDLRVDAYLDNHSLWVGDLDISENTLKEEYSTIGVGEITLTEHSTWQGKVISGDSRGIGLTLVNESNWNITDSSRLSHLYATDSAVSFMPPKTPGEFSTLTIDGELYGTNNLFVMNTDLAGNKGDLIDVKGELVGDSNKIQVNNQGSAWVNLNNELTIVKTAEGGDADYFTLNNAVEAGGFEYYLKQVGTNWNLYSTGRLTSTAQGSMNLVGGSYLLNYAENQTLLQRMGELRDSEHKQGVWARVYGGKFTSSGNSFLDGYEMTYTGLQVGRDKKFNLGENKGNIYFGGMFGYGKGSLDYGNGSGNVDSKTLGLYGTYMNPNGFYADAVLKYNKMKNDYQVLDTAGVGIKGEDINTDGVHFSLEVGQRIHLDRQEKLGWYVEPQAQISVGRVTGGDFTASNGLRIHVDDYNTVLGRVGMLVGYEVKSGKNPVNIYGKVSYVHEFDGDVGYRFNGISVNDSFGDSWITYGVGATAQFGKNHNLYLDIERASGGQFNQPWAVNGGYRFTW